MMTVVTMVPLWWVLLMRRRELKAMRTALEAAAIRRTRGSLAPTA